MTALNISLLAICVLALMLSAFFSAIEVAIFTTRGQTLKSILNRNASKGEWIHEMLSQPRRFLAAIFFGNALVNAIFAVSVTFLCHDFWNSNLHSKLWIPVVLTAAWLLLFGELIPKAIGRRKAATIALGMVGWLRTMEQVVHPVLSFMDRLARRWEAHLIPPSPTAIPTQGLTEDEYVALLDIGTREGALRPAEKRLIEGTLELANRNLRDLMTPRNEMCCIDAELSIDEIKAKAASMHHRRLPIYSESLDSIVGILNVRRFLLHPDADLIACIEPPAFVPETITALNLLKNFMRGPQRMAMVVDEFGGIEGLITLEDIVEEVFGEIYDEYDVRMFPWEETTPGVLTIRGAARLSDLSKRLGVNLEGDGVDTLGGWLTDRLGALPREGDECSFGGYSFRVEKMRKWRVGLVVARDERKRK